MENLLTFVPENLMILVACIYVLGIFLKKMESVPDKFITIILMSFAVIFAVCLNGFVPDTIVNSVLQGILCWGVSVGVNQTIKQLGKEE